MVSILDELVTIQRDLVAKDSATEAIRAADAMQSPSLMIILCSCTRALLRFTFEFLKVYFGKLGQVQPSSIAQKARIMEITYAFQSLPYKLGYFESMFHEVETGVRSAYTEAKLSPAQRSQIEAAMFVDAEVPEVLHPLVSKLLTGTLVDLQDKVDMSRLFFYDTRWLGLKNQSHDRPEKPGYDVLTKTRLGPGMELRVCRRCGSFMQDRTAGDSTAEALPLWMLTGQKTCICLTYWNLY